MTFERPMFPPGADRKRSTIQIMAAHILPNTPAAAMPLPGSALQPAQIGRRSLLKAFAALLPATSTVGAAGLVPLPTAPSGENPRLLRLGVALDQAAAELPAAIAHMNAARDLAQSMLPELPAAITFLPSEAPPHWCVTEPECDVDGPIHYGPDSDIGICQRRIASAIQLEAFVRSADGRTTAAKQAKRMLPIAEAYWSALVDAVERSGYPEAADEAYRLARRISRLAGLIYRCRSCGFEGLAIKARALLFAVLADTVDSSISHRSEQLYAEKLATGVLLTAAEKAPINSV